MINLYLPYVHICILYFVHNKPIPSCFFAVNAVFKILKSENQKILLRLFSAKFLIILQ